MESLSNSLTNKLLHTPSDVLNHASADERDKLVDMVNRLYQLDRLE